MIPLLTLLACRPDPGTPVYPDPGPWTRTGDDFYVDTLEPGEERLGIGIFYEGATTESWPIDDTDSHFYIYENTFSLTKTDDRWEGYEADTLTKGSLAWWGGGVHWDTPRDLSDWDTLHLTVSTDALLNWDVGLTGGGVEARVPVGSLGLAADDTWHEIEVPLSRFADSGADLTSVTVGLLLVGDGGATGDEATIDGVYFSRVRP